MNDIQDEEWEKIRQQYMKSEKKIFVDGDKCRSCVWANIESGYILCSRICDGERCYTKK